MQAIGYVRSPYRNTQEIPKGLGAKHETEGLLEIRPEFEPDSRTSKASLISSSSGPSIAPRDLAWSERRRPTIGRTAYSPPAHPAAESDRPNRGRTAVARGPLPPRTRPRHAGGNPYPRHQALSLERPPGTTAPRLARRSRSACREHPAKLDPLTRPNPGTHRRRVRRAAGRPLRSAPLPARDPPAAPPSRSSPPADSWPAPARRHWPRPSQPRWSESP